MRVETREPSGSDVRTSIDSDLVAGDIRRTDTELRIGAPARLALDQGGTGYGWRLIVELAQRFSA
jgi:hypothetical protein